MMTIDILLFFGLEVHGWTMAYHGSIEPPTIIYKDNWACAVQMETGYIRSNINQHIAPKLNYPPCKQSLVIILLIYSQNLYHTQCFQKCVEVIGMKRLKCLQGSGGVILHDIWPVLNHHITLFSLYEFCLIEVFSSKVFNEVISTKLYASSLIFPHRGFMHDDYKHIFFWILSGIILIIQKILCTPYFSHRVFEEMVHWKTTCRWSNGFGLIKGKCYEICTCDQTHPMGYCPRVAPLGKVPLQSVYNQCFTAIKTYNCHFLSTLCVSFTLIPTLIPTHTTVHLNGVCACGASFTSFDLITCAHICHLLELR
jgi:hypothetical protein